MVTFLLKKIMLNRNRIICIKKYLSFPVNIIKCEDDDENILYYAYYPVLKISNTTLFRHNNLSRIKESVENDIRYYMSFVESGRTPPINDRDIVERLRVYFYIKNVV